MLHHKESEQTLGSLVLVGEGRTAEIFEWGEGRVLRLFRPGASTGHAQREMRAFRLANEARLPCPAVYPSDSDDGLIAIEGRLGFVMDRIDGPSMLKVLAEKPWKLWRFARALAGLHLSMHQQDVADLPSQRERFRAVIERLTSDLGEAMSEQLHARLDALDDGHAVCHGDFHPDNVILSNQGPVIIDWGPATSGSPAADVAWTVYLFRHGGYPPGMTRWGRIMLATLRRLFLAVYRRAYSCHSESSWNEVERWESVIAAIRLGDGIPEERESLLYALHTHFG